jgi:hypothetical protein
MHLRRLLLTLALLAAAPSAPLSSAPDALAGYWTGNWEREGALLGVAFTFSLSPAGYTASFDSDALRVIGIPLRDVSVTAGTVSWRLVGDESTTVFTGKLHDDTLVGTFEEGKARGTLALARSRTPPPRPREEELDFANGNVKLAGTLLLPAEAGPHPGIVFLHGSGPEARWASRFLATRFAERGVAALIYDKRGVGGSTGDWRAAGFDELAGDAAAAVAALRRHPGVLAQKVGIHGHSQGGILASLVADEGRPLLAARTAHRLL